VRLATTAFTALSLVAASLAFTDAPSRDTVTPSDVPFMAVDMAGDANALNGQGLQEQDGIVTPAQLEDGDITSARIVSRHELLRGADGVLANQLTGVELRTGVTEPGSGSGVPLVHRFMGTIAGCEMWAEVNTGAQGGQPHGTAQIRMFGPECGIPDDADTGLRGSVTLRDPSITFEADAETSEQMVIIDLRAAPSALTDRFVAGEYFMLAELAVRHSSPAGVTAPVIDEMPGDNGYTIIGEDIPPYDGPQDGDGGNEPIEPPVPYVCTNGATGGTAPTQGSDRTGVTADSLTIGVHAPVTGAAPVPSAAFEQAADSYWRWVTEAQGCTVLGRNTIEVELRDDRYAPDSAIQACSELGASSVMLTGLQGADQLQACGGYAEHNSVPYMTTGTTESRLKDNPWYFAASMTFKQQGGLLAQYVKKNPNQIESLGPDAKIGTISTDTPNFSDALDGWHQGLAANGLQSIASFEHSTGDRAWYASAAQSFQNQGIDVIYFLSSPVDYINFAKTANERFGYNPQFVGLDSGLARDAVLGSGCGELDTLIDNGIFLSATGGVDTAPTAFHEAAAMFGTPADDIALSLWAMAEAQHQLLDAYGAHFGADLTREDLRAFIEGSGTVTGGVHPTASYSSTDHLGGESMHIVQADCASRSHVTLHRDAQGF
jgi:ABC-type branched-subunit amino acid transport system substrate-binding protein